MPFDASAVYKAIKSNREPYQEEKHCPLILEIMNNPRKGTISAFCVAVGVCENTFYNWVNRYEVFGKCYRLGKMMSRENWEDAGRALADLAKDDIGCDFEYWRMIGWSRFGVGKNSRIRLDLNPKDNPSQHYAQLLKQASEGDFTAGEIKQLMEAINVGLNAHQVFELQNELNQLKSDLTTLNEMKHGENTYTNKGIA